MTHYLALSKNFAKAVLMTSERFWNFPDATSLSISAFNSGFSLNAINTDLTMCLTLPCRKRLNVIHITVSTINLTERDG